MRCNYCGFENESNVRVCIKCKHTITQQPISAYGSYNNQPSYNDSELRRTRLQNTTNFSSNSARETVLQNHVRPGHESKTAIQAACPLCHYPMNGNYCANCGYEKGAEATTSKKTLDIKNLTNTCQNCRKEVSAKYRFCPECGAKIESKTINPFAMSPKRSEHQCRLILLDENGQDLEDDVAQDLNGDTIILNRDNTEPTNRTISSKEQAVLAYENNEWTIQNRSEYEVTMVAANRKIGLQSGDIILLGNRRFRFEIK